LGFLLLPELILLLPFQLVILQCASQHIVTFGLFLIVFNLLFQLSARQLAIWHLPNLKFEIAELKFLHFEDLAFGRGLRI